MQASFLMVARRGKHTRGFGEDVLDGSFTRQAIVQPLLGACRCNTHTLCFVPADDLPVQLGISLLPSSELHSIDPGPAKEEESGQAGDESQDHTGMHGLADISIQHYFVLDC